MKIRFTRLAPGFLIYTYYPRPGYWSLGNIFAEVYLTVPILQCVSGIAAGIMCGMTDWKPRPITPVASNNSVLIIHSTALRSVSNG